MGVYRLAMRRGFKKCRVARHFKLGTRIEFGKCVEKMPRDAFFVSSRATSRPPNSVKAIYISSHKAIYISSQQGYKWCTAHTPDTGQTKSPLGRQADLNSSLFDPSLRPPRSPPGCVYRLAISGGFNNSKPIPTRTSYRHRHPRRPLQREANSSSQP